MGLYQKGAWGIISGKIGKLVAARWKNKDVLRTVPSTKRNKKDVSQKILAHRAKFSYASNFLRAMSHVLKITFPEVTANLSARNSALAALINEAISGEYPNFSLNYETVKVGRGSIGIPMNPAALITEPGKIHFTWDDSTGLGNASKADDKAVLIVYCPGLNVCMYSSDNYTRQDAQGIFDVRFLKGKVVHTWMVFTNAEGKKASDSHYLGEKTVMA